ncbi:enamine deaminase RidA (YjgF/YER057c/UK114 family) [Pelomonas saccharophila]|uniref:Enamine deaminase RidA (YjgF/YER057c/UK114 family) n=1 Tax=Roseateles saccharophilus TaxID=304 RepID=A0ABU1YLG2_ROSSA|nr:RidA family protein [Roseateles saccharophilus]MDR7269708.1 enamine deaminase RidA (YjgF/YER057c/UK114 family) [Roseateles saccharophilus]
MTTTLKDRLASLGHTLPEVGVPAANYFHHREGKGLLVIAGQIGTPGVGALDAQAGRAEAEVAALKLLAVLDAAIGGDLGRVRQVLRLGIFVAAAPGFTEHSAVADGASNLVVAALGEIGRHARAAIGVASLPAGAAVEVEALVELVS